MKHIYKYLIIFVLGSLFLLPATTFAGNKDRAGEARADQLLINPWARTSGWGAINTSNVQGIEGMFSNIAGLAFVRKTEVALAHTKWLYSGVNNDIAVNSFGLGQRVGESGVLGIHVMAISFGEIEKTTYNNPEGKIGTFSPQLMNINIGYAKAFSNSIYGGFNFKLINESISNVSGMAIAFDGGIQYVTGPHENIHFGVSMKNVGSKMKYGGDGLSIRSFVNDQPNEMTLEQRSAAFELPSLINIGAAYDFLLATEQVSEKNGEGTEEMVTKNTHRVTAAFNFRSNSFTKDQYGFGVEYAFKEMLMLRGGFVYEEGLLEDEERTNAELGPSGGFTFDVPLSSAGNRLAIDYSYRNTENFDGTHCLGVRIKL